MAVGFVSRIAVFAARTNATWARSDVSGISSAIEWLLVSSEYRSLGRGSKNGRSDDARGIGITEVDLVVASFELGQQGLPGTFAGVLEERGDSLLNRIDVRLEMHFDLCVRILHAFSLGMTAKHQIRDSKLDHSLCLGQTALSKLPLPYRRPLLRYPRLARQTSSQGHCRAQAVFTCG